MGNTAHANDDRHVDEQGTAAQRSDTGGTDDAARGHHAAVDENGKPIPPDEDRRGRKRAGQ